MGRTQVFISYAHADEQWRERVESHLLVLAGQGQIDIWDDRKLEAGDDWLARIDERMGHAGIAVLLISSPFLNSEFIKTREVPALFKRHEAEGMKLYPLLIRSCPWQEVDWLARLQIRPVGGRPVSGFRGNKVDEVLTKVALEIAALARNYSEGVRGRAQGGDSRKTPGDALTTKSKRASKGTSTHPVKSQEEKSKFFFHYSIEATGSQDAIRKFEKGAARLGSHEATLNTEFEDFTLVGLQYGDMILPYRFQELARETEVNIRNIEEEMLSRPN